MAQSKLQMTEVGPVAPMDLGTSILGGSDPDGRSPRPSFMANRSWMMRRPPIFLPNMQPAAPRMSFGAAGSLFQLKAKMHVSRNRAGSLSSTIRRTSCGW